jgi:hypothetical protein
MQKAHKKIFNIVEYIETSYIYLDYDMQEGAKKKCG